MQLINALPVYFMVYPTASVGLSKKDTLNLIVAGDGKFDPLLSIKTQNQGGFYIKKTGIRMPALESILPDDKSTLRLACFKASAEFIQIPHVKDGPDDYRLVHGNVATLSQDVAVNHAWVEEIDFVYELSEGHKILFSKDDYYKKNKIINVRTYTAQEAITLIGVYGHWGPWN